MSKQPEALRLAESLEVFVSRHPPIPGKPDDDALAAAELRRLHAVNAELLEALHGTDRELSRVLHELAGAASMCWSPVPEGGFESSLAILAVEAAISELRPKMRAAIQKATGEQP